MKVIIAILFLGLTTLVHASCDYEVSFSNKTIPWDQSGSIIPIKLDVKREGSNGVCLSYFVTMSKGSAGSYLRRLQGPRNETLNYNLYTNSSATNIIKEQQDISSLSDTLFGFSVPNRTYEKSFYAVIKRPEGTNVPLARGGLYSDTVTVNIYSGIPNFGAQLEESKSFTLSTFIPKAVDISLVERGAEFDINDTEQTLDFGNLVKGKTLGFDLRIQTNAGYTVFFESFNRGQLKHESKNDKVSYTLKVDNKKKNLKRSGQIKVLEFSGTTEPGGNVHKVDVTIGKVKNNSSHGLYSDYVTITAMTKE